MKEEASCEEGPAPEEEEGERGKVKSLEWEAICRRLCD